MLNGAWIKEFAGAITVTDVDGIILEMNDQACKTFKKYGGAELIGRNMLDVHPEPARTKVAEMLKNKADNSYTIEKNGVKKIVYQRPWYQDGSYAGFVEFSLEIPFEMPHFVRKS